VMIKLDDRLREIIGSVITVVLDKGLIDPAQDQAITAIKKAFADSLPKEKKVGGMKSDD